MIEYSACIIAKDERGRILSVTAKNNPKDYVIPGGKLERGENAKQAAIRELKEETGLSFARLIPIYWGLTEFGPGIAVCFYASGKVEGILTPEKNTTCQYINSMLLIKNGSYIDFYYL